jgi:hypothetical protein
MLDVVMGSYGLGLGGVLLLINDHIEFPKMPGPFTPSESKS